MYRTPLKGFIKCSFLNETIQISNSQLEIDASRVVIQRWVFLYIKVNQPSLTLLCPFKWQEI